MTPDQEKFEDILAAHAAGRLSVEQRQWLKDYLAANPGAEKELLLVEEIRSILDEETKEIDPREGLDLFMAAVRSHPKKESSKGILDRLNTWLNLAGFTPALASGIVVVQIGVIAVLVAANLQKDQQQMIAADYRGIQAIAKPTPNLKLTINPSASFSDLADLLTKNGCRIVGGPTEFGEIWVSVDEKTNLDQVIESLDKSLLIDDVMMTKGTENK